MMNRFHTLMSCEECMKTKPNVVACGLIFEQPTTGNQDNSVGGWGGGIFSLFSHPPFPLFCFSSCQVYRDDLCLALLPYGFIHADSHKKLF